jgi:hypothetical protein
LFFQKPKFWESLEGLRMKKKVSVAITGLALLFVSMTFAGCPSEFSLEEAVTPYAIPGPAHVTARVYEGIILLTWNPVPDAAGYQIFRRDETDNIDKAISGAFEKQGQLYYIDTATLDNNLIDGHSYTYTVCSLSGQSGNRAVLDTNAYIGNGKTNSNTVRANVPDRNDTSAGAFDWIAVDPASIRIEPIVDPIANSQDTLLVTWDAKPNLTYRVVYSYGKGAAIDVTGPDLPKKEITPGATWAEGYAGYSPLNPKAFVKLPIVGGENSISVIARFIGDTDYYSVAGIETQTENFAKSGIATPDNFIATRSNTTVTFAWDDVEEAASYTVYKAPYSELTGTVAGDWATVEFNAPPVKNGATWIASELNVAIAASYYYTVIATGADGKKSAAANVKPIDQIVIASIAPSVELLEGFANRVQITWERIPFDADVSYELFRSAIEVGGAGVWGESSSFSDIVNFGPWTAIAVDPSRYLQARGVVTEGPPGINSNTYYAYKLVVKKGPLASDPGYAVLAEKGAFIKANYYQLKEDPDTDNPHGFVALRLDNSYAFGAAHGVSKVELYKRVYDPDTPQDPGNPQEPYVLVVPEPFTATAAPQYWIDRNVTVGTQYQYRIAVKYANGTSFVDLDQNAVEIKACPKVAEPALQSITLTGATARFNFAGSHLAEAPITINYDKGILKTTASSGKIAQETELTDADGPPNNSPAYSYSITGLDFGTTYNYAIYVNSSRIADNSFTTAGLRLETIDPGWPNSDSAQPHGSIKLQLTSVSGEDNLGYDGDDDGAIDWSDYAGAAIAVSRQADNAGAWTPLTGVRFTPRDFYNGSSSQTSLDLTPPLGARYQYRAAVTGSGTDFSQTPYYAATDPLNPAMPAEVSFAQSTAWQPNPSVVTGSATAKLVFYGEHLAGAPLTVEYTTDNGVTWTSVATQSQGDARITVVDDGFGGREYSYTLTKLSPSTTYSVRVTHTYLNGSTFQETCNTVTTLPNP